MRLIGEVFSTDDLHDEAKEEAEIPLGHSPPCVGALLAAPFPTTQYPTKRNQHKRKKERPGHEGVQSYPNVRAPLHTLNDARPTPAKQRSEAQGFFDELNAVAEDVNHCYINTDDLSAPAEPKAQKKKPKTRLTVVPKRKVA